MDLDGRRYFHTDRHSLLCAKYFAPKETSQLRKHINKSKDQNHEQWRKTRETQSAHQSQSLSVIQPLEMTYQRLEAVLSVEYIVSCRSVSLDELTTAAREVRALWEATTTYPELLPTESLPFGKSFPNEKEMFVSCMAAESRHVRVFVHGMDGHRREDNEKRKALAEIAWAFSQKFHQNKALSAAIKIPDYMLDPPPLSGGLAMLDKGDSEVFWSFEGSFTDLHVDKLHRGRITVNASETCTKFYLDDGWEAFARPVDGCEKVFFLFPPTVRNLEILAANAQSANILWTVLRQLEGGVVVTLESAYMLYIPAGALHAVVTVTPGFLLNSSYLHSKSVLPMSVWMHYSLAAELLLTASQKDAAMTTWLKAARAASDIQTLLNSWEYIAQVFPRLVTSKKRTSIASFWQVRLRTAREFGKEDDTQAIERILAQL